MAQRSINSNDLEAEIERVRTLRIDQLRTLWRSTFGSAPPPAFTKDLLARMMAWRLQEQSMGGLDRTTVKLLNSMRQGENAPDEGKRRLKTGTVLVREYQGERHTVTVVPGGFVWREITYASLSTIARAITGTAWNGPRFFGLRVSRGHPDDDGGKRPAIKAGAASGTGSRRSAGAASISRREAAG
jgi:hypothetical protein